MAGIRVAKRYAKALIEKAQEEQCIDSLRNDVERMRSTLKGSKELQAVIKSPVVSNEAKQRVLKEVFKDLHELSLKLINLLIDNNRISILDQVLAMFQEAYNKLNNIQNATVITASVLEEQAKQTLITKLKSITGSDQINLKTKVDERLLGGFVLRINDVQYDASVLGKLNALKTKFSNTTV